LWTVDQEWGLWEFYRTPNIGNIVQEIVNRGGWNYGNAMAFMMKGENQGPSDLEHAREVESFENIADPEDGGDGKNHPERAPQIIVYYKTSTGIAERITSAPSFVLSPNPVNQGKVTILLGDASTKAEAKIYNQQGKLVLSSELPNGSVINLDGLTAGLYLVSLYQNGAVTTQKLIVE